MRLVDGDGPKIIPIDIAGSKSVIEALRSGVAEAEEELVAAVQKARTLSAVRNEALVDLKDKYGMRGNHA